MSFRARILIGLGLIVLLPLAVFELRVRADMAGRLTAEYQRRVASLVAVIRADLSRDSAGTAARLDALKDAIAADNRFRLAALQGADRAYLLDYAGNAMRVTGLAMLQVQDDQGRIISSGHFRNEYDRVEPELPRLLAAAPGGMALVETRTAEASLLALARADSLRLGGRRLTLVGGVAVDSGFLARLAPDSDLAVSLALPTDTPTRVDSAAQVVSALAVPFVDLRDAPSLGEARIVVTHSLAPLAALRRRVDAAFAAAVLLTGAIALLLASWLSNWISRPLRELARRTAEIDMERLDVAFESDRADEIGALSRLLGAMTQRLRAGAARLREAERRIAVGDLARQVNHDIKNGLIPIRNVFRHLLEAARGEPDRLAAALRDRQGTIESGISYLENLATNYARLYPQPAREPCDVNAAVRETIRRVSDASRVSSRACWRTRCRPSARIPSCCGESWRT